MRPSDLPPVAELAADKPHGNRIRYMSGCKCMLCRAANSRYETDRARARRAGDWNGLVPADRARRHLRKLAGAGVGKRSVAEAGDVPVSIIDGIRSGRKRQIRARTERSILSVTREALAAGQLVDARPTWVRIRRLLREGFTRAELARRLGYRSPALQFRRDTIRLMSAVKIERFYNRIMEAS